VGKAKKIILFDLFDLISLFQTYENRIFEAFSHGSVVNNNYMFSFKWILSN
jgi:hypothetical protein